MVTKKVGDKEELVWALAHDQLTEKRPVILNDEQQEIDVLTFK